MGWVSPSLILRGPGSSARGGFGGLLCGSALSGEVGVTRTPSALPWAPVFANLRAGTKQHRRRQLISSRSTLMGSAELPLHGGKVKPGAFLKLWLLDKQFHQGRPLQRQVFPGQHRWLLVAELHSSQGWLGGAASMPHNHCTYTRGHGECAWKPPVCGAMAASHGLEEASVQAVHRKPTSPPGHQHLQHTVLCSPAHRWGK